MGDGVVGADRTDEWAGPVEFVSEKIAAAPRCAALLDIWKRARGGTGYVPGKSDVDPIVLGKAGLLPYLWIIERDDAYSFLFRLAGESIRTSFNAPIRGRNLREVFTQPQVATLTARCERMLQKREVLVTSGTVYRDGRPIYYGQRLTLPLLNESGECRFIIGTVDHSNITRDSGRAANPVFSYDFVAFVPVDRL